MRKIRGINNKDLQPREKLQTLGIDALSNDELIAILIHTGTKEKNVLELSKEILNQLLDISYLKKISLEDLQTIKGIKLAKAAVIIAAVELGRRISSYHHNKQYVINDATDVYELLKEDMSHLEQEHLVGLYVDSKGRLIKKEVLSIGTITQTFISPRDVLKHALRVNAFGIFLIHNHPSGDSNPSSQDFESTKKLISAFEHLNIFLIDHIVIGKDEFYSLKMNKKFMIKNKVT